MLKVQFETLGCRLNQIESEAAANYFKESGFAIGITPVTSKTQEDLETCFCFLNTCAVTQKAEQKARRIIRLLLKKYPQAVILVTGCYAQIAAVEIEALDDRIVVLGGQIKSRISEIPELLKNFVSKNQWNYLSFISIIKNNVINKEILKPGFPENSFNLSTTTFLSHSRASIKIQDGCNNNCSYCAIHIARGKSVSIDVQTAIDRVKSLEAAGHSEVVITTVNIGQYRGEYNGEYLNFSQLLKLLLENTNTINFRISSLYPEIVTEEFCSVIKNPRVCPHFHISVQSGSDKILNSMNRNYKASAVIKACQDLRNAKENPFLACDIITGFPGETAEDFKATLDLIKKCKFAWIHAFPYSERPGTAAATMKNKIPQSISGERAKIITEIGIKNKIDYINSYKGKVISGILETLKQEPKADNPYVYHLVTENFIHCQITTTEKRKACNKVDLIINEVLTDKIQKGGEIEAIAEFVTL